LVNLFMFESRGSGFSSYLVVFMFEVVIWMNWIFVPLVVFQTIGAEYGEGFETFRPDGPLKVDVVRNLAHLICVFQLFSHMFVEFGDHAMLVEAG
jgi:hypothetical protein